jgi:septum formation protein
MTRPRVILASASPRRRELLTLIGIDHEVRPANIDESYLHGETPRAHAERLARAKAAAIDVSDAVTIGSDTIVVVDGDVLGKPRDRQHAAEMLRRLSGRSPRDDWRGGSQARKNRVRTREASGVSSPERR